MSDLDYDEIMMEEFLELDFTDTIHIPIKCDKNFHGYNRQVIHYNDSYFVWVNGDEKCYPFIIVPVKSVDMDEAYWFSKAAILKDVLEFLSIISIEFVTPIDIHHSFFKNRIENKSSVKEQAPWIPRTNYFDGNCIGLVQETVTELSEKESLIAGLFRDGLNNDNIFYSFFSFYKIFECYFKNNNTDRGQWIDDNYQNAKMYYFRANLIKGLGDWDKFALFVENSKCTKGYYLRNRWRLAIAHANKDPLMNPNEFSQYYEMYYAKEVIKGLALYLIVNL